MKTNSPQILIDAANSPVQQLPPVGMRSSKPHVSRPWGFKGTMVKPHDWETKQPYKSHTPTHWKYLSLVQRSDGYTLLSFATNEALLKADLRFLKIPTDTQTWGLGFKEALELGEQIEQAFKKVNKK